MQFTCLPLTRFGFGLYRHPIVSADEDMVELLAALVYSPSEGTRWSAAPGISFCLDGPGGLSHEGVWDPESSLWSSVAYCPTGVTSSNIWGVGVPDSGVARGRGDDGERFDVSGTTELLW